MDSRKGILWVFSAIAGGTIIAISTWFGLNGGWSLPVEGSSESVLVDQLFKSMLIIAMVIFLGVQGSLIFSVFAFRQKPGDDSDGPPIHGNIGLEVFWTAVPAALVLWLAIYSFDVTGKVVAAGASGGLGCTVNCPMIVQNAKATSGKELVVKVIAQQFGWTFIYPGAKEEVGELRVPANRDVLLEMESKDVIHAFWVPQFRLKQDVIPGRVTRIKFTATKTGDYPLVCAELCGAYHGAMRSTVSVDTPEAFEKWAKTEMGLDLSPKPATNLALKP